MTHWYNLLFFGVLLYFWMVLSIAFHEAAHVLVGKAVGFAPYKITIGKGNLVFRRMLLGIDVHLLLSPVSGFAFPSRTPLEGLWWRGALFALAGPVAEIVLALVIGIPLYLEVSAPGDDSNWQTFLCILAAAQVGRLLANIYPSDIRTAHGVVPNDGKSFLSYVTGKRPREIGRALDGHKERVAAYEPAFCPDEAWFLKVSGETAREFVAAERDLAERRWDAAVEKYLKFLNERELSRGEKAMLLDAMACIPVITGESSYLEQAIDWAKQARELCPESITLQGTQGSLLVEAGQYGEGIALLQPLTKPGNAVGDQAISACYLAKAWDQLGDEKQASYWMEFAKESGGSPVVCAMVEPQLSRSKGTEPAAKS